MKLAIDENRCKGCNLCTKVCPYKIFKEGKKLNRKGIVVPELGHERAESVPFSEQPSKWDSEPAAPQLPMKF